MNKLYLYINETATYDLGQLVIDGYEEKQPDYLFASIEDLRLNLTAQRRLVDLHLHPGEQVLPWGGNGEIIVLQEGMYQWNPTHQDYVPVAE